MAYRLYWGDLHCHAAISYGHGSLERALVLAKQQLDFATVTGHAFWPDMPTDRSRYGRTIDYHLAGFAKLHAGWDTVQRGMAEAEEEGAFVPLLSYEWHSSAYGDHHVLYRDPHGPLIGGETLGELRQGVTAAGQRALLIPHHIAYPRGVRGINWDAYDPAMSPLVEIYSLHGCSESDEAPYPLLHTMGPRDHGGTAQEGLARGHRFGFVASTDQHSGYPGSYGEGRLAAYATSLTRDALWDAFLARRTYAVTGDKIQAQFMVNGVCLGSEMQGTRREITVEAVGDDSWDTIEVVKNGRAWHRWAPLPATAPSASGATVRAKVRVEWGWARPETVTPWEMQLDLADGHLLGVETCFRGPPVVRPDQIEGVAETIPHQLHGWNERGASWGSSTSGNITTRHATTQAIVFHVEMPTAATLVLRTNGLTVRHTLNDLLEGARAHMTHGPQSPAVRLHRAVVEEDYTFRGTVIDRSPDRACDYYYVRLAQRNGQLAWLSPVWVAA